MATDIICGNEEPTFDYICMNIFGTWPEDIVWNAIHELAGADIMYIDFKDEEEEECDYELLMFNPDFIGKNMSITWMLFMLQSRSS